MNYSSEALKLIKIHLPKQAEIIKIESHDHTYFKVIYMIIDQKFCSLIKKHHLATKGVPYGQLS